MKRSRCPFASMVETVPIGRAEVVVDINRAVSGVEVESLQRLNGWDEMRIEGKRGKGKEVR